jgi:fused signal recognition particle receptor
MFGFLKDKLKNWLGKSKSEIEVKAKKSEVKAKPEKSDKKKTEKIKGAKKVEKRKRTKQELDQERITTAKVMDDIKTEGVEIKSPEEKLEREIDKLETNAGTTEEEQKETKKLGFFERLKKVFSYTLTETNFEDIFSELEFSLLESNVALEVVETIKAKLKSELVGKELKKDKIDLTIKESLKNAISEILIEPENVIEQIKEHKKTTKKPYKILFFGINGAGKTTSIAKLCHLLQKNKLSCILAAADTFRAASIEQLELHGNKLGIKVIKHTYGSDPSAVAFDAIKYAETNKIDVVLIDTAGRMHTKDNLLKEMEKICRVTQPNLKVFVAEAVAGNDATEQAKAFNEMIGIDGSILSKTDVDEKGGAILSISYITKKPILFLGVGQRYEDLELFNKKKVIENLGL